MDTATKRPRLARLASLDEIAATEWNALVGGDAFLSHEFLSALEHTGCVGPGTAWDPCHLVAHSGSGQLIGALPLYVKYDSRGEFVFDWSWADAYERAGMSYYPKLVSSVPFTPATGARLLVDPDSATTPVAEDLVDAALGLADEIGASSLHVLFPTQPDQSFLSERGFLTRKGCQFHWRNRGYSDFDDFLSRFNSHKRKKARRERRRIREAGIVFDHLHGDEPSASDWDAVFEFYSRTFHRRGRAPYLSRAFFDEIARTMPEKLVIALARYQGMPIATAICFRGRDTLYGRYWGSMADFHSLHFEACYHQGIEYCIREGIGSFEPGTQGEHKISRGFAPTATWSCHWLSEPGFYRAVEDFVEREQAHVDTYMEYLQERVPFRRGEIEDRRK